MGFVGGVAVAGLGALAIAGWTRDTSPTASATTSAPTSVAAAAPASTTPPTPTASSASTSDVSALVSSVSPGIVSIEVTAVAESNNPFGGAGGGGGGGGGGQSEQVAGSGFVFDANGLIATNAHVVDGATSIKVNFSDGTSKTGTLVGIDHTDDLAVVKVDATGLHALALGDSSTLKVGQRVVAVGNALDLTGGPTVTEGIVSALDRSIDTDTGAHLTGLIQTDASINPGNSGGPLLDLSGNVVGINSAGATDAQNVGFSIAMTGAKPILQQLGQGKTVTRPFIGVSTENVDADVAQQSGLPVDHGIVIVQVSQGSPAETAGLRRGDVITEVDGKAITDTDAFGDQVKAAGAGTQMKLTVQRNEQSLTITVTLGTRSA
jgi:S1-C subfamily serine protease